MAELLYNIKRVFGDYLTDGQVYNIPEYQRGYKWTDHQILQLLNDINDFETGGNEDLFYCLQNITLVPNKGELKKINIVDGQQRLTTITLLLAYLQANNEIENKLIYAVRKTSNDFLQKIIDSGHQMLKEILETKSFDDFLVLKKDNEDYDYQDIYFMYSAVNTINSWFLAHLQVNKQSFKDKLLNHVKLIVNRIENVAEEELFMNLNAGKVQLDGSDLARAILITRVAKQEVDQYDENEIQDILKVNERRTRIGWELDEINAWWSKQDVKGYFSYFTNMKTGEKETILFDQEKHPIDLLYKIWTESKGEKFIKLSYFETKSINARELYISIIHLHRTLVDWYNDREIYHYLGFLFSQRFVSFTEIWDKWNERSLTRIAFKTFLRGKIEDSIFEKETKADDEDAGIDFWIGKIKDYNSINPTNWYFSQKLEKFLLLLDIIEHAQIRQSGVPLPFLKPRFFRNYKEDKEHIYPGTPREVNDIRKLPDPIGAITEYIVKLNEGYSIDKHITWSFTNEEWESCNDETKDKVLTDLKDEIHHLRPINSIGNLVLLHLTINRGFGNDYYADKRNAIIFNTESGLYVRNHTLKVFVKQTTTKDLNSWTMSDIKENANRIANTLIDFFHPVIKS